jgi:hypothetical protein
VDETPAWRRPLNLLTIALAIAAVVILCVRVSTFDWVAVGDDLTIKLRTLDVGGSHTPLVGVYSRFNWNHPGPMLFYTLALPLRLLGGDSLGLLFGAILINLAAIGSSLWIAARARRDSLPLVAFFITLLCLGLNLGGLADPWNPYVIILPMFATVIAAWRTALGDRVAAIVLVIAGSFALQSHLGSGGVVVSMLAFGSIGILLRAWRGPNRHDDRRTLLLAAVILLVCWIPPIVEQLTHSPGNLRLLFDFLRHGDGAYDGFASGARIIGRVLSIPGNWVRGAEPVKGPYCWRCGGGEVAPGSYPIPWALFALVGATWWAWRRRWTNEIVLCATAFVLVLAGFFAASRVSGVVVPYLVRWVWVIGAATWLAVGAVLLAEIRRRAKSPRFTSRLATAATAIALIALIATGPDLQPLQSYDSWTRTIDAVVDPTVEALQQAPQPVLITSNLGVDGSVATAVLDAAEQHGIDVRRTSNLAFVFGPQRAIDPAKAKSELVIVAGDGWVDVAADPRFRLVTSFDPLSPDERAEVNATEASHGVVPRPPDASGRPQSPDRTTFDTWIDDQFHAAHKSADYERYRALAMRGDLVTIFISDQPPG